MACETLAALPDSLDTSVVEQAEAFLVAQATRHDPRELARLGRHLRHTLQAADTDGDGGGLADQEELQRARQALVVRQHDDGSCDVRGHLGVELTAELLSQLQPLAGPKPSTDGTPDLRTVGQRTADALAELLRRAAIAGGTPARHGSRASITVTMALETLQRRLGAPAATLDWSGPISAATARRLACDAQLVPVVLGADGEPLDVGRASYPVTQAIWRALVARDGGCAFNGCGRPPEWTEAHHVVHWADGGETSVQNCCLFCDHHHRVVHHDGWQVELIDGVDPGDPATLGRPGSATSTQHQPGTRRASQHAAEAARPRPPLTNACQPSRHLPRRTGTASDVHSAWSGPCARTRSTCSIADRSSPSHSSALRPTSRTDQASASDRDRATPAATRVSSTMPLRLAQPGHHRHREVGEQRPAPVDLDAPGDLAVEPVLGLAGDRDPLLAGVLAEAADPARPRRRPARRRRRPRPPPAAAACRPR